MEYPGQLIGFCKNQHGSKYMQRILAKANPETVDFIVKDIADQIHELMVDNYGNYFCQKLMQSCSAQQRLYLLERLSPHIMKIACDKCGTHSMQTIICMIGIEEEEKLIELGVKNNIIEMAFENNATHVL